MGDDRGPAAWAPLAKLRAPSPAPDLVLDDDLVAGATRLTRSTPLTVVVAAPGAGKTTLAAAVATAFEAVAWIRFDEHDDDPTTFLGLVTAACGEAGVWDRSTVEPLLAAGVATPTAARRAVAVLLDDLGRSPRELLVVLDDLHALVADEVLDLVAYLVEHLPDHVHVLATSRSRPRLPLARLAARQQLGELGDEDLALDVAQATRLLNEHLDLGLDQGAVAALVGASSGWVTGIRLLGRAPDALGDYIDEELLGREPTDVARFLTDVAVLETVTPTSAGALTGRGDAGPLLWDLARRHALFVEVVDRDEPEYRLHDLLRSHLRRRLRTLDPDRLGLLHQAAATTVASEGERIEHLLAAQAWADAAEAIDEATDLFAGPARLQRAAGWVERLPDRVRSRRLRLATGLAAVRRGEVGAAAGLEPMLPELEADGDAAAVWLVTRALLIASPDRARWVPRLVELERSPTFAGLPPAARADHHLALAHGALLSGDWDEVGRRVGAAIDVAVGTADVGVAEALAQHLSPLLGGAPGVIDQVARYADWAADRLGGHPLVDAGVVHQRAWTALLRGDVLGAAAIVRAAPEVRALLHTLPYLRGSIDWILVTAAVVEDDRRGAEEHLHAAIGIADATALDESLDDLRRCQLARLLRRRGDVDGLRSLVGRLAITGAGGVSASRSVQPLVAAQLAWAGGDLRRAEEALGEAVAVERVERVRPFVGSPRVDLALLLAQLGRERDALAVLGDAVAAVTAWGTPGLLVAAGADVVPLLRRLPAGPAVATALAALDRGALPAARPIPGSPEVLTGREVQVLRLLDAGASNQGIAEALVISANTAKSHVRNVLAKLGATSRGEAVAVARRRHLL